MTEGEHEEALEQMWERYDPIRTDTDQMLTEWRQSLVRGNPTQVREEVRVFAERQNNVFRLLVLTFEDLEQFWADLQATIDETAVEHLKSVRDQYKSQLGELFRVVFGESNYGYKNSITETDTDIQLKTDEREPLIKFEASSGAVPVFNLHQSPSHFLDLAETHASSVKSSLEIVDQIGEADLEDLERQLSRLQERTGKISEELERIETVEETPENEESESETTEGKK